MPEILTGMRISIAFGWTTLVAAEMVAAKAGIGVMVLNAARFLAVLMRKVERLLVPWKGKA
jgi:taurine transport system permease protein